MAKTRQSDGTKPDVAIRDDLCCSSLTEASLNEAEATELGRMFGALADPVRLRLLSLVASQDEVCSCDLEGPLDRSQPTISHHTRSAGRSRADYRREAWAMDVVASRP